MSIKPTELPEALKRKATKHREMANKRHYGASISTRPEIACLRLEEGHWEGDTVVGKRRTRISGVFPTGKEDRNLPGVPYSRQDQRSCDGSHDRAAQ